MIYENVNKQDGSTVLNRPTYRPPFISIGTSKKRIIECLKKGKNSTQMVSFLNISKSTILQHLKELEILGYTTKEFHIWRLTKLGFSYENGQDGFNVGYEREEDGNTTKWLQDRAHNLKILVEVENKPKDIRALTNWKMNDKLNNRVIFYTDHFGDIVTTYTGISFIFQLPILRFKNSQLALAEAGRIAKQLINRYEKIVPGLKLGKFDISMQVISQHHAVPQEPYAKWCWRHGISYKDEMIDIDGFKGSPELEFIDPKESHIHHENYITYVKDFSKEKVLKPSEVMQMLQTTQLQIQQLAQAQHNLTLLLTPKKLEDDLNYSKPNYFG